jgi:glycosyltransferase involved in cell wall biosynthesis
LAHEYITACGVPREKIAWIPNGVDLSRFGDFKVSASSEPEKVFKVMYLGAHGQANALDVLIQTAKNIQDQGYYEIRFILVGDGPEKPKLMALAKELGLLNVEFRDPVPKSEVAKVLHEADAFFVQLGGTEVYRYGISSNKLFDFMAAGKPVFSSAAAPKKPVEEAGCGFTIPPRDPDALAEAVIKLYQMSPQERAEMGKRGREYVEKHHDIRKLAAQLESVLQSVLSGE